MALDGADIDVPAGAVHAVIGENGAGKSTLVKILSGIVQPDDGNVELGGDAVELDSPRRSRDAGIATAFQELTLAPDLTVADNLCLPHKPRTRIGTVSHSATRAIAASALEQWEAGHIDVRAPIASLSLSARQQVEIVGALARRPRLLILDEPTSALGRSEAEWLFRQVKRLRHNGCTVIFVSHRLAEVRELCDSLTVMRNGRRAGSSADKSLSDEEIIRLMIGESLAAIFPEPPPPSSTEVVLAARDLRAGTLRSASLDLHRGEILGIAALQDHGQRQLFRALFGAERLEGGSIELDGEPVQLRSPRDAIGAGIGISLVPEQRATEGALLTMPGRANLTLPILDRFTRLGWIDRDREQGAVVEVLDKLGISHRALFEPVEAFSGGNQQKIVIGKWLLAGARVLLLYDPTRGVDIKTKAEIYRLIAEFAAEGNAVLLYSTDLDELSNLCHRVHVCYRGEVGPARQGDAMSTEALLSGMLGGGAPVEAAA